MCFLGCSFKIQQAPAQQQNAGPMQPNVSVINQNEAQVQNQNQVNLTGNVQARQQPLIIGNPLANSTTITANDWMYNTPPRPSPTTRGQHERYEILQNVQSNVNRVLNRQTLGFMGVAQSQLQLIQTVQAVYTFKVKGEYIKSLSV